MQLVPLALFLCAASMAALEASAQQQSPGKGGIYSCVTADGRRLTSDRPIPECKEREQRLLNNDGSTRRVVPPAMSPDEQAVYDARQRREAQERVAQQDAVRRDRNLLQRFPDAAAHQRAREAALDDINKALESSERRIRELAAERKPLLEEAEFYKNKTVPLKLRQQLETNEASTDAQRVLIENQKAELVRVNKNFDEELARLRKLWAGATPGSLPLRPAASAASEPAVR
ncbi:hypothetical protein LZ017_09650 [Pelomonas sp. CA6]|uniref:hypothetical protein n=1 Tax=Pelomonas sp. CA6 TaxID=2907999 RepID=UPI001F4BE2EB|nr:hypothetical protein [Pelomonas sp. CA6]MCH7343641.1 hypothetical protein [Pelomonas sp. CA6]